MGAKRSSPAPDDFFSRIPLRSLVVFHLAVFFVFAPVGLLFSSSLEPQRALLPVVINAFVSGMIAVCWAAAFTVSRWFVAGIVLFNALMVALVSILDESPIGTSNARPSPGSLATIVAIAIGYILFIVFISRQGKTTVRLMTEMSLARDIHVTLVPPVRFENARVEALGLSSPSTEMGGDLIDVVDRGDVTDLFLADVSGHGVRAGVVMGMVKSAIRMALRRCDGLPELLANLNEVLEQTTSDELYATFAALRVDGGGRVEYGIAGHHPIVLFRADSGRPQPLGERSLPLGLFGAQSYRTQSLQLRSGDLLALYTDGLNETTDADDRELGHDAVQGTIRELATRPLRDIQRAVFERVERHGGQDDDRTLLLVRAR